MLDDNVT